MGNTNSGEEGRHRLGFHVLRVKEGSPASKAGIRPFFDYIVAINGVRLNTDNNYLQEQMLANEDKPLTLDIYSTREQAGRRVEMIPTKNWGDGQGGLIGCSISFCMFDAANDVVWHILDVARGSPAERAGLCAHTDYVIGTPYGIMQGEGDLYDLVEDNIGESLRLYVFNSETEQVREIVIVPNEEWGGDGLLGCDVGYGYLHRLPRQGSIIHRGSTASPKRAPSLPYPPSQDMTHSNVFRNTVPASFPPGEQPLDIFAPTPRPPHSPSWLNQNEVLEGALKQEPNAIAISEAQEADLPPLRFGRGERPDAEDEPESEDELMSTRNRSVGYQNSSLTMQTPTSPTILKQFQGISLDERHQHTVTSNQTATQHNISQTSPPMSGSQGYFQPSENKPNSPSSTRVGEVNAGEIPFGGASSLPDFTSQLGINHNQRQ